MTGRVEHAPRAPVSRADVVAVGGRFDPLGYTPTGRPQSPAGDAPGSATFRVP